jgi:hypothetical protein
MASQPVIEDLTEEEELIVDDVFDDEIEAAVEPEAVDEGDIHFEDEAPASVETETPLVAHLRRQLREERKQRTAPKVDTTPLGPRPTQEQYGFDDDAYNAALDEWIERKTVVDAESRKANDKWEGRLRNYEVQKVALAKPDYDDVADLANATFSDLQRSLILNGSENAAKFMYAVGKSPAKLASLAAISDPIDFLAAVVRAEGKITMTARAAPPEPEYIPRGTGSLATATKKPAELVRLEKEFERTGDVTNIRKYKKANNIPI